MKLELKNRELKSYLSKLESLKGLTLDGDIAIAAVILEMSISKKSNELEKARILIVEGTCSKDESGKPKKTINSSDGQTFFSYEFDSTEKSQYCADEIEKIESLSNEFEIKDCISVDRISKIACSTDQMKALLLLTS